MQLTFPTGDSTLHTRVITQPQVFDELFDGFTAMHAVSYVASPDLLLDFLDRRGYRSVEVVVGEEERLAATFRQALAQKGPEVTERLVELARTGALRVYLPGSGVIHTKLYLLEREDLTRVLLSTANFTETARRGRQVNYAWYADVPKGHPFLRQVRADYEAHRRRCTLFLEELLQLWEGRDPSERRRLVEAWLAGEAAVQGEGEREVRVTLQEALRHAMEAPDEPMVMLSLPSSPAERKKVEQLVGQIPSARSGDRVQADRTRFLGLLQQRTGFPVLHVAPERQEVILSLDGSVRVRSAPPEDPRAVNEALANLEEYCATVDLGQCPDPQFAKASVLEALLYVLASPFAHEYMKAKRARRSMVNPRGPRYLYLYGPSHNGKTTFLYYALKLLAGQPVGPAQGPQFSRARVLAAAQTGSVFPLVFDDMSFSHRSKEVQDVLKFYWEAWWDARFPFPQLVFTSNAARLQDWARTRVKRIDFTVHFVQTEEHEERLNDVVTAENSLAPWFFHLYLREWAAVERFSNDELFVARAVLKTLYEYAGRPLPPFFPHEPLEQTYDPGKLVWRGLLGHLKAATMRWVGSQLLVEFRDDIPPWQVPHYQAYLPQHINAQPTGRTLEIQNGRAFQAWLREAPSGRRGWRRWLPWRRRG